MTNRKTLIHLLLLVFSAVIWPSSSQAQTPEQRVIVIYPAAEPQDKSMALSVFFTITDPSGRPIPDPNIESAEIQLLGGNTAPITATVAKPQTPFYIALVLDASGSMANVMPKVHEAAKSALDNAPPNARFAVIKFNDLPIDAVLRPIQDFTNDLVLVKSGIDAVNVDPNAPTCLYNALDKTIELLDSAIKQPQERRAIILFTDGRDERANGAPCSQRTYDDVIYRATRPAAPITPIHTIGLCSDAQCSNIKRDELKGMAKETFAFSAAGSSDQLGTLFQEIMNGLNSQLVAKADVFAHKGENQAVLSVKLRDVDTPLTATFSFSSDRDYVAPPPPVEIQIMSVSYDAAQNIYKLVLSISGIESVQQVIIQAWDTKLGQIPPDHPFDPATATKIELKPEGFEAGHQYVFRVLATDKNGTIVKGKDDKLYLAESGELTYQPPQAAAIKFKVNAVNTNFDTKKLIIDLDLPDGAGEVYTYEGFLVDAVTGNKVGNGFADVFSSNRIEEDLPEAIQQTQEERSYRLNLFLTTKDGRRLETDPYEFKVVPVAPPSLLARIWSAVQNPVVWVSIVIIILSVTALVIYWNRPAKKETLPSPLPRPPIDQTMMGKPAPNVAPPPQAQPAKPRQPRLRLKVLQAPAPPPEKDKFITTFPFVIGRNDSNFNISDQRISRQHVEISLHEGKFFVTDLESRNGTFIGETRLPPRTPTPMNGLTIVRLGQQTRLELEPQ